MSPSEARKTQSPAAPRRRTAVPSEKTKPTAPPAPANTNSVAATLATARRKNNLTIEQAATMLKIRRIYLEAIEDSNWKELPELVYAHGFVRSYADFLGLDANALCAQFKKEFRGGQMLPVPVLEMPEPIDNQWLPDMKLVGAAVAALVVLYGAWAIFQSPEPTAPTPRVAESTPTPLEAATATEADNFNTIISGESEAPLEPIVQEGASATEPTIEAPTPATSNVNRNGIAYGATAAGRVIVTAIQDSWVQMRTSDGQVIFSRVMRPGDTYNVPDNMVLSLTTGNLAGLHFETDGREISPQTPPGKVFRNLPLSPDQLAAALAQLTAPTASSDGTE